jgi:D-alanyl-D-alanine carboxypeptidase/D-alanyl-D-alanine-endopeptidase (penicillin-binding protein 4)
MVLVKLFFKFCSLSGTIPFVQGLKKYSASTTALILLIFWPTMAQEFTSPPQPPVPEHVDSAFATHYLHELKLRGRDLTAQGLYVESLDGSTVFADHQGDVAFNPASVIKIATSFAALDRLGAEYQFETAFEAAGEIKEKTKTLEGDLVLASTGDPTLETRHVTAMIRQVIRSGVKRVKGSLVVTGPFTYASYLTTPQALRGLETLLRRQGIRISKPTRRGSVNGTVLATHLSEPLRDIVWEQNAFSVNRTADRMGEAIGGPKAVRDFLVRRIGIPDKEIFIGRASGLEHNRITPHGTVQLLRYFVTWLNFNNLLPQDVLPVAGMDRGTLHARFTTVDYRGSVIGKTGTLPATEGGVSTLAGFVYTRDRGVLLFAIFNTKGNVNTYRRLQDSLIKDLIAESGGAEFSVSLRKSNN